ncbi:alpha/beta hydrolase [Aeromonas bivalvium]|uniref:alpha/beta hydrolase n=1 Tax=Aeromonas bivalvium TaxID=440079 RepID=UPI00069400B5|nr:alpha/beta hydrolase [Aeromonas bivalvium]
MHAVRFANPPLVMAGHLHMPASLQPGVRYPAIVCVHPSGGVKEQTAGLYAARLAEAGFIALAFDASYQGESGGEPRQLENPYARVEDISAAVDYLTTLEWVDSGRIGVMGICAGGGYAAHAAMMDTRIQAIGTVSAVNYGQMYRQGWENSAKPQECLALRDLAMAARTAEANGEAIQYLPTTPERPEDAPHSDLAEAFDYYRTDRARHGNAPSKLPTRSLAQLVTYDAFSKVELFLTQPLLVIAGSDAGTRWMSEALHQRAASQEKELLIVEGGTHIGMYDLPHLVEAAMDRLAPFYKTHL